MSGKFITRDVSGMIGSGGGKFNNDNEGMTSVSKATPSGPGTKYINANSGAKK